MTYKDIPQRLLAYGVAVLAVAVALLFMLLLDPWFSMTRTPFLLFFGAVMVSAWHGGVGPGLLATALSALASNYFLLASGWMPDAHNSVHLMLFGAQGGLISFLCEALLASNRRSKQSLRRLRESEGRFNRLVEANIVGVITADTLGAITEANDAFLQMLGYSREDLLAGRLRWDNITPPEQHQQDQQLKAELLASGSSQVVEKEYIHKAGHRVPVLLGGALLEDGHQQNAICFVLDLTERKRLQAEHEQLLLREQSARTEVEVAQQQVSKILESMTDAFIALDLDWRVTYANREAARINNKPAADLIGLNQWEEWPATQASRFEEEYRRALTEGVSVHFEAFYEPMNLWLEVHAYPFESGLGIFFRDVSERKRTEEFLRESEERKRLALAASHMGEWEWDAATDQLWFSERVNAIFDLSPNEPLTFTRFLEVVHEDDRERVRSEVERVIAEDLDYDVQYRTVWRDGSIHWVAVKGRAFYNQHQQPICMLGIAQDITERKWVEASYAQLLEREQAARTEAEEAREQVSNILESITDGFIAFDRDWRFTYLNHEGARTLNHSPEELLGKNLWHELPELANTSFGQLYQRAVAEGIPLELEDYYPPFDAWFSVRAYPSQSGLALYFRNINERKQVQEALRISWERLDLVLQSSALGLWYCDLPFDKLVWNDKCKAHFGLSPDAEVDIDLFYELLHPEDREPTRQAIEQSIEQHQGYDIDYRTVAPDGQMRWIRAIGRTFYNAAGKPIRFDGITIDTTERKQSEEALRESEQHLRLALQTGRLGSWQVDFPSGKLTVSEQCKANFGLPADAEILNNSLFYALHPEDRPRLQAAVQQAVRQQTDYEGEYRNLWPDGSTHWILVRGRSLYNANGVPMRMLGVTMDITARKQAEQERAQLLEREQAARAEAEKANRVKDEFLATLSHELRTPLNGILGWSQMLRRGTLNTATTERALETIERNARAQVQLIDDLLDISRIIRGQLRLEMQPCELVPLISTSIDALRPGAEAKGIQVESLLDPTVGTVAGDANRLQQVLWNLLSNALKFTPGGGRVQVTLVRVGSQAEIRVSDTGKGINPEFLPYVFERFRQADSSITRAHGGLGLGLAIVRHLVELHGGSVAVESPGEGQGATFSVRLPLLLAKAAIEVPRDETPLSSRPVNNNSPDLEDLKILVVDDEADARELLIAVLQAAGAQVKAVSSASEALSVLPKFQPHVLVSDIGMPDEDGYRLIQRLRSLSAEQGGKIPAVALTAYAREQDRRQALSAGFQTHLSKPIDPADLVVVVASLAGRRRIGEPSN
ncbi:PAS domain S-box protein [Leptolyngbya sp. FACHB-261]|uniref:PAS domain S-box protein n=1 Tax=Leptolyngbya sp. FACHB-261 TaxID=2692806 RepID=UPI001682D9F8|nr:PAS domain S-box protein [Leptolyngbya sp. FACHB-261]MBD2102633.1 PAS domain S-box protein [Leptolyngbya sp. FACHB-261]